MAQSDTLVRTATGVKRVADVQIGDYLYDGNNQEVLCIATAAPATGKLKRITYQEFDSSKTTGFDCAPDHHLTMRAFGTTPTIDINRNSIKWFTRCDRKTMAKEAVDLQLDTLSDSFYHDLTDADDNATVLPENTVDLKRYASIRSSLERKSCNGKGFRKVRRFFKNIEQAQLAHKVLVSDHHHLIDPFIISNDDEFCMTVEEYEKMCCKPIKQRNLKLYRAALTFEPSVTPAARCSPVPVDPYFLGLWIGDGSAADTSIASADPETAVWLQNYVERLNSIKPLGARALRLSHYKSQSAGTVGTSGFIRNMDAYVYRIVCPRTGPGYLSNPVYRGLQDLGLLNNKSLGIPTAYMEADEDTRLAVIAGLIDSDGSYNKGSNMYNFLQMTEDHRKIVYDLKELALSCGICVTGVYENMRKTPFHNESESPKPKYAVSLGKGSNKFQHHLKLPRKRMDLSRTNYTHDARPFTVSDAPDGEYRAIEVSGGQFQLENRLVVHNCYLNACPVGIATQDLDLRKKFEDSPEHVNFFYYVAVELHDIIAKLGFGTINEMVGHTELLRVNDTFRNYKTANIDLSPILTPASTLRPGVATYNVRKQNHNLNVRLDNSLIDEAQAALENKERVVIETDILNTDCAVGASLPEWNDHSNISICGAADTNKESQKTRDARGTRETTETGTCAGSWRLHRLPLTDRLSSCQQEMTGNTQAQDLEANNLHGSQGTSPNRMARSLPCLILLNVFFAQELAIKLSQSKNPEDKKIVVSSCNPGLCMSPEDAANHNHPIPAPLRAIARDYPEGCKTHLFASIDPSAGMPGEAIYYSNCAPFEPADITLGKEGDALRERVWNDTLEVLGVTDQDFQL